LGLGVTGETDGTEGFAKSISEAQDLGGEDTPSTNGGGGGLVGPETSGSRVGCRCESICCSETVVEHLRLEAIGHYHEASVGWWGPWHVWKWWDCWGLWWAEHGGEGVLFTVCGEDSDVCIPDTLGGRVCGDVGAVGGVECATGGPDVLCSAGWEESDLSEIELGGAG